MGIKTYGKDPFVSIGLEVSMKGPYLKKISLDNCFVEILPVLFAESIDSHMANPIVSTGTSIPTPLFPVEILKNRFLQFNLK